MKNRPHTTHRFCNDSSFLQTDQGVIIESLPIFDKESRMNRGKPGKKKQRGLLHFTLSAKEPPLLILVSFLLPPTLCDSGLDSESSRLEYRCHHHPDELHEALASEGWG
jgi:hypothetical protein